MSRKPKVNNDYYNHLGDSWYSADRDPIAVLRAEQKTKNPWVLEKITQYFNSVDISIADIGCGAGFLTNYLGQFYKNTNGLDASESSLKIAKIKDVSKNVEYTFGDAYRLPYKSGSMDIVCAMDFLEHVEDPAKVIAECSRILKPGGLFFFHTFNRNFLSWLIVIKFMEWFVPNTPKNLHVLHLFIKPSELEEMMRRVGLVQNEVKGLGPKFNWAFLKSFFKRRVTSDFEFKISEDTKLGYIGYSIKE